MYACTVGGDCGIERKGLGEPSSCDFTIVRILQIDWNHVLTIAATSSTSSSVNSVVNERLRVNVPPLFDRDKDTASRFQSFPSIDNISTL